MSAYISIIICGVITSAVGSVINHVPATPPCRKDEFICPDGFCISADLVCNKFPDCPDGYDEAVCFSSSKNLTEKEGPLGRFKRQNSVDSTCRINEWKCKDGTCISSDQQCDGVKHCPDGSDETHPLCRNTICPSHLFRCTYGACVDGNAACNNTVECSDRSDELIPRCRVGNGINTDGFQCQDGSSSISLEDFCDGTANCRDGSDELVQACGENKCFSHLFQCAYGACVDQNAECNGVKDCADGSDEADELCNTTTLAVPLSINRLGPVLTGKCELPNYPQNGKYEVVNQPGVGPGQRVLFANLKFICDEGYGWVADKFVYCQDGKWSLTPIPDCVRHCKLDKHPSVTYRCLVNTAIQGTRACKEYEPEGTEVKSTCNLHYYTPVPLRLMKCQNGAWDNKVTCLEDCGRLTPDGEGLIAGGKTAKRGEFPWHVGIYRKDNNYEQKCGGSLISNKAVITAAHCFWDELRQQLNESQFAVAAAKLFRDWDHPEDRDVQKSEVERIYMPELFLGNQANNQEDIAVVILKTPVVYHSYVRPVCLDFQIAFDDSQLQPGHFGKVAGWGLTGENSTASDILNVVDLPYVSEKECVASTPLTFREHITGDKICAGYTDAGTAVCQGDSGGGLVFNATERDTTRFYLRGVVSSAPRKNSACNIFTVTTFTRIIKHEKLINRALN